MYRTNVRNVYALEQFLGKKNSKCLLVRHSLSGFKVNEVTPKCHVFMVGVT